MTPFEWLSFTCFHIFVCVAHDFQCGCICDELVHEDTIMDALSPLSCSMTSGKSGRWCDASLSCLRISTPQKPWSPTAELKTCWLLTMDSRTLYLPASASAALSTIHPSGHPFWPQVSVPLMSRWAFHPCFRPWVFTHNPHLSFILEATSPHISAFSGVLLYFVGASSPRSVCSFISSHATSSFPSLNTPVCLLSVWNLGAWTPQHWFFHSFLELCSEVIGQCRK